MPLSNSMIHTATIAARSGNMCSSWQEDRRVIRSFLLPTRIHYDFARPVEPVGSVLQRPCHNSKLSKAAETLTWHNCCIYGAHKFCFRTAGHIAA